MSISHRDCKLAFLLTLENSHLSECEKSCMPVVA